MRKLWLIIMLIICPVLIGRLTEKQFFLSDRLSRSIIFPLGFFVELAIFELLAVPLAFLHLKTSSLTIIYTCIVLCLSVISLISNKKVSVTFPKHNRYEWLYLLLFVGLFTWQLINAIRLDFTVMSADDNSYVTWANDAVLTNRMYNVDAATGVAGRFLASRALQSSLVFPSALSILSGVSVVTIEHCVLQVFYLILAYTTYYYMADALYKTFENRIIFLIFVSLLYIYGYYADYNTSFRLLMPNYQGKAVLAVSLTPLLFAMTMQLLKQEFEWRSGFILFILSLASVSLTLIGAAVIVAIVGIPIILSLFTGGRKWKHLLYIPITCIIPAACVMVFLVYRYAL